MNAYELADWIENGAPFGKYETAKQAVVMLRQQQAEIEGMQERMIVAEKELNHMRSFFGCDPAYYGMTSAEPVAWMQIHYKDKMCVTKLSPVKTWEDDVPLYTHPAKTLTDEEILDALQDALSGWIYIRQNHGDLYGVGWDRVQDKIEVILKKASEK